MRCSDCVHYEVCGKNAVVGIDLDQFAFESRNPRAEFECLNYKPNSRFVELPCEVGQTVYTKYGYSFKVERIEIFDGKMIFRCGNDGTDDYMAFYGFEIGTEVFLSREEAEKALQRKEDEGK